MKRKFTNDTPPPARVIVPSNELHFGFQIEVEALAVVKKVKKC